MPFHCILASPEKYIAAGTNLFKPELNPQCLLTSRLVLYTGRHEGVCTSSVLDFVLCQTIISPFIHDTEGYDAEGHGRRR